VSQAGRSAPKGRILSTLHDGEKKNLHWNDLIAAAATFSTRYSPFAASPLE
jgi:hypothetical protein